MKILSAEGNFFTCKECGLTGYANLPTDYQLTICNGEKVYSIICPRCGHPYEVAEASIPSTIRKYIKVIHQNWYHD